jgi:hypothetical protein
VGKRYFLIVLAALCATLFPVPATAHAQDRPAAVAPSGVRRGVPRADCFPFERLPADQRAEAEKLLLAALDSEALYTLVGGMKPMSSGFATYRINVKSPDTKELDAARRIFALFRCGDAYQAEALPFHRTSKVKDKDTGTEVETRFFEAVVLHRPTVAKMVTTYTDFFAPYGITPATDPFGLVLIIEHDPTTARNRGLGYLYGYPKSAVDFFVASADEQGETKVIVPRDFIQIPTFVSDSGRFVYAVPKGYKETDEDNTLKEKARRVLVAYKERRARYIGAGKPGVVALIRDWFDDGKGNCAPENARY